MLGITRRGTENKAEPPYKSISNIMSAVSSRCSRARKGAKVTRGMDQLPGSGKIDTARLFYKGSEQGRTQHGSITCKECKGMNIHL